jgi:uncharacterized protein YxeA
MANEQLQNAMIEAMITSLGVVTTACKACGVSRQTHYGWLKEDESYRKKIEELREIKKDFIESKLMQLVNSGDTAATIFSAKTQLKDRGYVERTEQDLNITGASIQLIMPPDEPAEN